MRIGTARVKIGGILSVETEEPYRLKGYATRVMNSTLDKMKADKYAISVLLGIRDFYHRFGYAPVMANPNLFIKTDVQGFHLFSKNYRFNMLDNSAHSIYYPFNSRMGVQFCKALQPPKSATIRPDGKRKPSTLLRRRGWI